MADLEKIFVEALALAHRGHNSVQIKVVDFMVVSQFQGDDYLRLQKQPLVGLDD